MSQSLFLGCFEYSNVDTGEDGQFQIVVEAPDAIAALTECRARLEALDATSDSLGPVNVFLDALLRVPPEGLRGGVLVNMRSHPDGSGISVCHPLPFQPDGSGEVLRAGDVARALDGPLPARDDEDDEPRDLVFWSGVERFWPKWKLYWCETPDHDEDWFVIARSAEDAARFHENAEGYDVEEASARLVCVLPASEQDRHDSAGWPSADSLRACGAELLPYSPQDEHADLRKQLGQGGRVVRLKGEIYQEGDIVSNAAHRLGIVPPS